MNRKKETPVPQAARDMIFRGVDKIYAESKKRLEAGDLRPEPPASSLQPPASSPEKP